MTTKAQNPGDSLICIAVSGSMKGKAIQLDKDIHTIHPATIIIDEPKDSKIIVSSYQSQIEQVEYPLAAVMGPYGLYSASGKLELKFDPRINRWTLVDPMEPDLAVIG